MSCDVSKFTISKGSDNTFIFTIKQDNSTLPMTIVTGDTFLADLVNLETGTAYPQVTAKALTPDGVLPLSTGRVSLVIPSADTANLVSLKGEQVDRYYLRPTYKLVINCSTTNNGDFIAKVAEVYVD